MKKLLPLLLALLFILSAAAAQADTLVVWFSCTGNTEALAATAAEALDADLWQIVPEVPYTEDDLNYHVSSCRANQEQDDAACRPAFTGEVDLSAYDTVVIAHPIWWGEEPRIIDTWMESVDLSGKRVAEICTSASSGIRTAYEHLQALAPDAVWLGAERFEADTDATEFTAWCEKVGLTGETSVGRQ